MAGSPEFCKYCDDMQYCAIRNNLDRAHDELKNIFEVNPNVQECPVLIEKLSEGGTPENPILDNKSYEYYKNIKAKRSFNEDIMTLKIEEIRQDTLPKTTHDYRKENGLE